MEYCQIVHWNGKLIADNYKGRSEIIKYEDLVPVGSLKEFVAHVRDVRTELTELVNKSFPVVEHDRITANAFLDTHFGPCFEEEDGVWRTMMAIQFYYIPLEDKE